jgi:hypothetical protein
MIAQEGAPTLTGRLTFLGHVLGDGRLSHYKTELEQLAMNARRTPKHIFNAHPSNQSAQFPTDLWAASQVSRSPTPVAAKTGAMPAHNGLWSDNRDDLKG